MNGRLVAAAFVVATLGGFCARSSAVNIVIDYTYDTGNFYGTGNPDGAAAGAQAKAALEAAGDFYSTILEDTLSAVQAPDDYISSAQFGQDVTYSWQYVIAFNNPATGASVQLAGETIAADEYRIYAGARSLDGSVLGRGGPGAAGQSSGGSWYFPDQRADIDAITADFQDLIDLRGEAAGEFVTWGGSVTFDSDGSTNWHYDHTTQPSSGESDFYSTAIHELGHALGLGASQQWTDLISGGAFTGVAATAANGGSAPAADAGHWAANTSSTVYGSGVTQEAVMDPDLLSGTRKLLTTLDAAALTDLGWSVGAAPGLPGDYNGDLIVDSADYATWRNSVTAGSVIGSLAEWKANFGASAIGSGATSTASAAPEPATAGLLLVAFGAGGLAALRLRRPFRARK